MRDVRRPILERRKISNVDYRATLLFHDRRSVLRDEKRRSEIQREDRIPDLWRHCAHRRSLHYRCRVHDYSERAKLRHDLLDQLGRPAVSGKIILEQRRLAARTLALTRGFFCTFG